MAGCASERFCGTVVTSPELVGISSCGKEKLPTWLYPFRGCFQGLRADATVFVPVGCTAEPSCVLEADAVATWWAGPVARAVVEDAAVAVEAAVVENAAAASKAAVVENAAAAVTAENRGASVKPPRLDKATGPTVGGRSPVVSASENLESGRQAADLNEYFKDGELLVATAISEGRVGALPKRINQSWAKVSEEYEQLVMVH